MLLKSALILRVGGNPPRQMRKKSNGGRQSEKYMHHERLRKVRKASIRCSVYACIIYLYHIVNPVFRDPRSPEVTNAIAEILEIARVTPEGCGFEMRLYFGLFMAGIAVFNEPVEEDLLRTRFKADKGISIYVCRIHRRFKSRLTETACGACSRAS